jgi:hypothetical protein
MRVPNNATGHTLTFAGRIVRQMADALPVAVVMRTEVPKASMNVLTEQWAAWAGAVASSWW